jgi:hypothetical protein
MKTTMAVTFEFGSYFSAECLVVTKLECVSLRRAHRVPWSIMCGIRIETDVECRSPFCVESSAISELKIPLLSVGTYKDSKF